MADSNITKRALAAALRELMEEMPFDKIQVAHICERCGLNRKSFYYHFKDKYDLVNWIFDMEFISLANQTSHLTTYEQRWIAAEMACQYFYDNRSFYRKALQIQGQNSFTDHLREHILPLAEQRFALLLEDNTIDSFEAIFLTDAILGAIARWLLSKDCMPPTEFIAKVKKLVQVTSRYINQEMNEK